MTIVIDNPPTLSWKGSYLEIIDQTLLPENLVVIQLATVDDVVDAISCLAIRGAPAIGSCGAYGMVIAFDEANPTDMKEVFRVLEDASTLIGNARPTAVNLSYAVNRVRKRANQGRNPTEVRSLILDEANAVFDEDRRACDAIGIYGSQELASLHTLMTHCNAGRLATTGIGTALGVVYAKARAGHEVKVFAPETRPLLQGARLTAWELATAGIPVTVIPDSSGCSLLASGEIDAVIVGADRIAANGDVANKIGTFSHAVSAKRAGVPFYVAAPISTLDPNTASGDSIEIEQRGSNEVHINLTDVTLREEISVWNPAFDVTPADLVTAIITDAGVLRPDYSLSIAEVLDQFIT